MYTMIGPFGAPAGGGRGRRGAAARPDLRTSAARKEEIHPCTGPGPLSKLGCRGGFFQAAIIGICRKNSRDDKDTSPEPETPKPRH